MKIAIASDDKKTISHHFGRALGFVIFEIEDGKIVNTEYKENVGRHSETSGCDHSVMIDNIKDCDAVISHGMGQRIFVDLTQNNIKPIVTDEDSVKGAIQKYLDGKLENHTEKLH